MSARLLLLLLLALPARAAPPPHNGTSSNQAPPPWVANVQRQPPCTFPVYTGPLSLPTFARVFKGRFPVVVTRPPSPGLTGMAAASTLPALLTHLAAAPVLLASSDSFSHDKRSATLGEYLTSDAYMGCGGVGVGVGEALLAPPLPHHQHSACAGLQTPTTLANETWYLFGDSVGAEWGALTSRYPLPLDAGEDEGLPVFGLGGRFSGVAFHTHGAAWAEVLHGRKRWWLAPPSRRPAFNPTRHQLQWALETLPQYAGGLEGLAGAARPFLDLHDGGGGAEEASLASHLSVAVAAAPLLSCELGPRQALYIPPGWWHATLNTEGYNAFVSTFTRERA